VLPPVVLAMAPRTPRHAVGQAPQGVALAGLFVGYDSMFFDDLGKRLDVVRFKVGIRPAG